MLRLDLLRVSPDLQEQCHAALVAPLRRLQPGAETAFGWTCFGSAPACRSSSTQRPWACHAACSRGDRAPAGPASGQPRPAGAAAMQCSWPPCAAMSKGELPSFGWSCFG